MVHLVRCPRHILQDVPCCVVEWVHRTDVLATNIAASHRVRCTRHLRGTLNHHTLNPKPCEWRVVLATWEVGFRVFDEYIVQMYSPLTSPHLVTCTRHLRGTSCTTPPEMYSQSHLGWHFRKLKAQSSNVTFATFQWKETFELWALSFETAFENVTPSVIGCTSQMASTCYKMWRVYLTRRGDVSGEYIYVCMYSPLTCIRHSHRHVQCVAVYIGEYIYVCMYSPLTCMCTSANTSYKAMWVANTSYKTWRWRIHLTRRGDVSGEYICTMYSLDNAKTAIASKLSKG